MSDYRPHRAAWGRARSLIEEARQIRHQAQIFFRRAVTLINQGAEYSHANGYDLIAQQLRVDASRKEREAALQVWPAWGGWAVPEKAESFEGEGYRSRCDEAEEEDSDATATK